MKWDVCCDPSEIHALCQFRAISIWSHDPSEWLRLPTGREKGVGSGSHFNGANRQRANKHAGKQCPKQCRGGYLGLDVLGFLFRLTLLRAHGKGGEQGPRIGEGKGRASVPQTSGCFLSLWFLSHWSSQPPFSWSYSQPLYLQNPKLLTGVSNVPRLDWSLSSSKTTESLSSHRIQKPSVLLDPGAFILHAP